MNILFLICRHEWLLFTRNRMQQFILVVFVIAALYAIYYGNAEITRQQDTIQYIRQQNAREQQELVKGLEADTATAPGMAAYEKAAYPSKVRFYLNYYAIDEPSAFAKLSIGQRDINPYYLQLNAQNLYLQLFKSEIANPRKLLAGNFDLSFVIIYLLPLLIIAFTYHLLSDEKERGTFPILQTQPVPIALIILCKAAFWLGITCILLLLLCVTAFTWSGVPLAAAGSMFWWLLISLSYAVCWFAFTLLVNAFNRSSAFNAMWSLGLWLLFLVVIPALLNLAFTQSSEVDPTRLTDFIRRRQGLGESKQEKQAVINRFYKLYPQYRTADTAMAHRFLDFQAYSAFVTLLDDEARPFVNAYYGQVQERNEKIASFNFINPAVNTQNLLNVLSRSGLENGFHFRESITRFHRQLSHFCFEPLFAGRMMTRADFDHIPVFTMEPASLLWPTLLKGAGWLLLLPAILFIIAYYRLRYKL
jgi:ABC-2 type transport system permease protein